MGRRNFLVEGVSCAGKTSVAEELQRRGCAVVHGDRELAYRGDPLAGAPRPAGSAASAHEYHVWDVDRVRAIAADRSVEATWFCGGSRNTARFLDVFDAVFVLRIDRATLLRRLDARPADEFGGRPDERALVLALHETGEGVPPGIPIDATRPLAAVVDELLARTAES